MLMRLDGGFVSFVFGWLKNNGVDTKGMTPGDAIKQYNEMREAGEGETKGTGKVSSAKQVKVDSFAKTIQEAKGHMGEEDAWRVSALSKKKYQEEHPNAKYYATKDGATYGLDDGDIISVGVIPKSKGGITRGKEVLAEAVKRGGNKLDSFSGNHGFYVKCGFEPVSWCEFDEKYKPDGWEPGRDKKEPVVFYKYVGPGKVKASMDVNEFLSRVKPSKDYEMAKKKRNMSA